MSRAPITAIAAWGHGRAFWVFDHVMAAIPGGMLLAPVPMVEGSLRELCALCPVPYESALAVIDQDGRLPFTELLELQLEPQARWPLVQRIAGEGLWRASRLADYRCRVYHHESGLRLAVADEFLIREKTRGSYAETAPA